MSTFLRPRVQFQRQLLSTRGDCRVKIQDPSIKSLFLHNGERSWEVLRTGLNSKLAGGSDRNGSTNVCLRQTEFMYLPPCAPCPAVNPIESGWSKKLRSLAVNPKPSLPTNFCEFPSLELQGLRLEESLWIWRSPRTCRARYLWNGLPKSGVMQGQGTS